MRIIHRKTGGAASRTEEVSSALDGVVASKYTRGKKTKSFKKFWKT